MNDPGQRRRAPERRQRQRIREAGRDPNLRLGHAVRDSPRSWLVPWPDNSPMTLDRATKCREKEALQKKKKLRERSSSQAPSPPCVPESVHRSARSSESAETAAGERSPEKTARTHAPRTFDRSSCEAKSENSSGLRRWKTLSWPRFSCAPRSRGSSCFGQAWLPIRIM